MNLAALAARLVDELRPYTTRIEIAGSIRRGKLHPKDIELVCIPKIESVTIARTELFAGIQTKPVNTLMHYCGAQIVKGERYALRLDKNGRPSRGERYARLTVDGAALDLFSVIEPASWGVIMAIRTGPAEFSRKLVTQRSKGGWLRGDFSVRDGTVWRDGERIDCQTEAEFFALCGMDYLEPAERGRLA